MEDDGQLGALLLDTILCLSDISMITGMRGMELGLRSRRDYNVELRS